MPNKIKSLPWLTMHEKILCNVARKIMGITTNEGCPVCVTHRETIDDIFRSCPKGLEVWKKLLPEGEIQCMNDGRFKDGIEKNIRGRIKSKFGKSWSIVFAIAIWWRWRWSNQHIFVGEDTNLWSKIEKIT